MRAKKIQAFADYSKSTTAYQVAFSIMRMLATVHVMLVLCLYAGRAEAQQSPPRAIGPLVTNCFVKETQKNGYVAATIQQVYECSGVWVTHRILHRCALEPNCSVIQDTVEGRATLDGALSALKMTRQTKLSLDVNLPEGGGTALPPMPTAAEIEKCKNNSNTEEEFKQCAIPTLTDKKFNALRDCFDLRKPEQERIGCFVKASDQEVFAAYIKCLGTGVPSPDKLAVCTGQLGIAAQASNGRDCVASGNNTAVARNCIYANLDQVQQQKLRCALNAGNEQIRLACFDAVPQEFAKARALLGCLKEGLPVLACSSELTTSPPGSVSPSQVMKCLATATNAAQRLDCITPLSSDLIRANNLLNCVNQRLSGDLLLACVTPFLGPDGAKFSGCIGGFSGRREMCLTALGPSMDKASRALDCLRDAGSNNKAYDCAASYFSDDAKRIASCIVSKSNADLPTCLIGDKPEVKAAFQFFDCVTRSGGLASSNSAACFDKSSPDVAKARSLVGCLKDGRDAVQCGAVTLDEPVRQSIACFAEARTSGDRALCLAKSNPEAARAEQLAKCAALGSAEQMRACTTPFLGGETAKFVTCATAQGAKADVCMSLINPKLGDANRALTCTLGAQTATQRFKCVAPEVGGSAVKLVDCASKNSRNEIALCLMPDKPEVRAVLKGYECATGARDAVTFVTKCTDGILDDKTRQTLGCVSKAGEDRGKLVGCAAGAVLPPEAARLVGCATGSSGATAFALCAAGPAMNDEWRIAAECAVQSGGNPAAFAGCTAGQLTIRELTKCFQGRVGEEGGCFGPNNTIIAAYRNAFNDLTKGPGEGNEVVKAYKVLVSVAGGPNSVIRRPEQLAGGPNSMINNPSQIWGGPNSVPNSILGGQNSEANKALRAMDPSTWRVQMPEIRIRSPFK